MKKIRKNKSNLRLQFKGVAGDFMNKFFEKNYRIIFPKTVLDYRFVKIFRDQDGTVYPNIGVYRNTQGKSALAKLWTGRFFDSYYYGLKNELALLLLLNKVAKRTSSDLPSQLTEVFVPRVIYKKESNNSLIFLLEYISAEELTKASHGQKIQTYRRVVDYLGYMGDRMTEEEKSLIPSRKVWDLLILFPLILVKAFINNPVKLPGLVYGLYIFISSIPSLNKAEIKLVHRDLNFKNILVKGRKAYLIDFQFAAFTLSIYEEITTLKYEWNDKKTVGLLFDYLINKYQNQNNIKKVFRALAVNSAVHSLTGNNFPRETLKKFSEFFDFVLAGKYPKKEGVWL